MHHIDFQDLEHRPRKVTESAKMVAANAVHVARLLRDAPYPGGATLPNVRNEFICGAFVNPKEPITC